MTKTLVLFSAMFLASVGVAQNTKTIGAAALNTEAVSVVAGVNQIERFADSETLPQPALPLPSFGILAVGFLCAGYLTLRTD